MMDGIKAAEIEECENCPLHGNDCIGGWKSGAGGIPLEPPCCSWNGDEVIYPEMYSSRPEPKYSPELLKCMEEMYRDAEQEKAQKRHEHEIERLKEYVRKRTGTDYKRIELRQNSTICHDWKCPHCHQWVSVSSESWHSGIGESWCWKCNNRMIYCAELEEEMRGER